MLRLHTYFRYSLTCRTLVDLIDRQRIFSGSCGRIGIGLVLYVEENVGVTSVKSSVEREVALEYASVSLYSTLGLRAINIKVRY